MTGSEFRRERLGQERLGLGAKWQYGLFSVWLFFQKQLYVLHHRIPRLLHRKCFSHFNTSYKVSSNNCYLSFIRFTTRQTNQIFSKYTFYLVKSKISLEIEAHCLAVVNVHFLFCLYVRDSDVKVET